MVAEIVASLAMLLSLLAESLHMARIRKVAPLVFGAPGRIEWTAWTAAFLRVTSITAIAWALTTLLLIPPRVHQAQVLSPEDYRHVVLILDVSPSMRLQDAGPTHQQSRMARASDVMESFFKRVAIEQYRMSVVAVYNGAKPVVVDTTDVEVVRNILNDLPMHYAFKVGKTNLFAGLEEAAKIAKPWKPRSTTMILISDGDTVPAQGMPDMPASVRDVVVVGIGDPITGSFIEGRQSRQDAATLRQIAVRLRGTYHNGNELHLSSDLLNQLTQTTDKSPWERLTRREYALVALTLGSSCLAMLPLLLTWFGSRWKPGVRHSRLERSAPQSQVRTWQSSQT